MVEFNQTNLISKLITTLIIIVLSIVFGLIPLIIKKYRNREKIIRLGNYFTGGILLGNSLFTYLPQSQEFIKDNEKVYDKLKDVPILFYICFLSFVVLFYFERIRKNFDLLKIITSRDEQNNKSKIDDPINHETSHKNNTLALDKTEFDFIETEYKLNNDYNTKSNNDLSLSNNKTNIQRFLNNNTTYNNNSQDKTVLRASQILSNTSNTMNKNENDSRREKQLNLIDILDEGLYINPKNQDDNKNIIYEEEEFNHSQRISSGSPLFKFRNSLQKYSNENTGDKNDVTLLKASQILADSFNTNTKQNEKTFNNENLVSIKTLKFIEKQETFDFLGRLNESNDKFNISNKLPNKSLQQTAGDKTLLKASEILGDMNKSSKENILINNTKNTNSNKIKQTHQKGKLNLKAEFKIPESLLTPYIIIFSLGSWSFFEGSHLGNSTSNVWIFCLKIILYKWAEAFTVGLSLYRAKFQRKYFLQLVIIYSLLYLVGFILGLFFDIRKNLGTVFILTINSGNIKLFRIFAIFKYFWYNRC